MPDDILFDLADSGALLESATLEAQVDRMLDHDHAQALVTNFAAQWLGSDRLEEHPVSTDVYPMWSQELAASMQREMEMYVAEFLFGDVPYTEFLTADFQFVDALLAEHYGLAAPTADFERTENTTDARRGVIGLAGFLTHTSRETRSSPIIRGKWVLDALLCRPLTLPPDLVVEPLPETAEGDEPTTVRELMDRHRAAPVCAGCHNQIDPIGLALENFDGIGRYRDVYETGLDIDTVTELPDGQMVDSLQTLTDALSQSQGFVPCAAEKFNAFALGRPVTDEGYFQQIVDAWHTGPLTLRNMIKQTILNDTFRMRRAEEP